ncbi:MAG: calcium-binding protein [Stackebrandtia sp.]
MPHTSSHRRARIRRATALAAAVSAVAIAAAAVAATASAATSAAEADLSLTLTPSAESVAIGDLYGLTATVVNAGPDAAEDVKATVTFEGAAAALLSVDAGESECVVDENAVTCDLGTLDAEAEASIEFTLEPGEEGDLTAESAPDWLDEPVAATTPITNDNGCTIVGTHGDDELAGTNQADVVCALGGADVADLDNGDDVVYGGSGDDVVHGDNGNDTVYSGLGENELYGDNGDDEIDSANGSPDSVDGGRGANVCTADDDDTVVNC